MNFLFYLLGRGLGEHREGPGLRPTPRQMALTQSARAAVEGNWEKSLACYRRLGESLSAVDLMVRGHLHLQQQNLHAAKRDFAVGIDRLLTPRSGNSDGTSIEFWLGKADAMLHKGRYQRATDLLRRARSLVDTVLAGEAGLVLAENAASPRVEALNGVVRLSDLTLRLLARAEVAAQLARSLEERQLRADLATWATGSKSVQELLDGECQRLAALAARLPGHAESHYRLGLVARAAGGAGKLETAAKAFAQVLAIHPRHVASATRLAATCGQLGRPAGDVINAAFNVPVATLQAFAAFARAAGDPQDFDAVVARLCGAGNESDRITARANLAFALSELALLDTRRACWRELVPAGETA